MVFFGKKLYQIVCWLRLGGFPLLGEFYLGWRTCLGTGGKDAGRAHDHVPLLRHQLGHLSLLCTAGVLPSSS